MTDTLGTRLRAARRERGESLRSVASALGLSPSLVSQVEIGKTQPSVSTLYALANHLGVSLDDLLGMASPPGPAPRRAHPGAQIGGGPAVQRAADNPVIEMENGVRWERLAGSTGSGAQALLVTYQPGASSSIEGKLMRHAGAEFAYVIEGELALHLEFETHTLHPGDSLRFDSTRPHMFANRSAEVTRGVWFVFGRQEQIALAPDAPGAAPRDEGYASAVDVLRSWDDDSAVDPTP